MKIPQPKNVLSLIARPWYRLMVNTSSASDTCRMRERDLKRLGRARAKVAKEPKEMTGRKHAREDGQANQERAARRARSDEPGNLWINAVVFDEDDDDGLPFGELEDTVRS